MSGSPQGFTLVVVSAVFNAVVIVPKLSHRGASFIEAVIIIPLGLIVAIALFDLGVLGFTKVTLELGASAIARAAVGGGAIMNDTTQSACSLNNTQCQSFVSHMENSGHAGDRYLAWAASPSSTPSRRTLVPMKMFDPNRYQGSSWVTSGITEMERDWAVMRPGEGVYMTEGGTASWVEHGMRPFGGGPSQGWPNPGERWADLFKRMPVQVMACARVETFIIGTWTTCGNQFAYYLGAGAANEPPPPLCPNTTCDPSETCSTCPQDCGGCGPSCGNGTCEASAGETCATCPQDCGACVCGDGVCQTAAGETSFGCCADCGTAGDGVCCSGENCLSAPTDCGCPVQQSCNPSTGQCECTPNCPQDYCGGDGCGGTCTCPFPKVCIGQQCYPPPQCGNGVFEPWGGELCDGAPCADGGACSSDCRCEPVLACPNGQRQCAKAADCPQSACPIGKIAACRAVGALNCCMCVDNEVPPDATEM